MSDYHRYVFDNNKFVGNFEAMYANENIEGYDSWHQENHRSLRYSLSNAILGGYSFGKILDLGCGKGYYTNSLKRANNEVIGVDGSMSAISKAQVKFGDIKFICSDIPDYVNNVSKDIDLFDAVVSMEVLSYIKDWKSMINKVGEWSRYLYITLYLPKDPLGYIKSFEDLRESVSERYIIVHDILIASESCLLLFSESKYY